MLCRASSVGSDSLTRDTRGYARDAEAKSCEKNRKFYSYHLRLPDMARQRAQRQSSSQVVVVTRCGPPPPPQRVARGFGGSETPPTQSGTFAWGGETPSLGRCSELNVRPPRRAISIRSGTTVLHGHLFRQIHSVQPQVRGC
eukprot:2849680-Prymnesium_polylepis.1